MSVDIIVNMVIHKRRDSFDTTKNLSKEKGVAPVDVVTRDLIHHPL